MSTSDHNCATAAETAAFEQLAAVTLSDHSLHSVLQTVADLTHQVLPGVEASVTLLAPDRATTAVYTGQFALDLDEGQYARDDGPCLHAARTGTTVRVDDARTETRWTDYMRRAVELGGLSSLSTSLGSPDAVKAALNCYSRESAAFGEDSVRVTHRFARFTGIAVANTYAFQGPHERADNLRAAMDARAVIDQAKDILAERYELTAEQAFGLLIRVRMATDRRLRDIAEDVVATGDLAQPHEPHGTWPGSSS